LPINTLSGVPLHLFRGIAAASLSLTSAVAKLAYHNSPCKRARCVLGKIFLHEAMPWVKFGKAAFYSNIASFL